MLLSTVFVLVTAISVIACLLTGDYKIYLACPYEYYLLVRTCEESTSAAVVGDVSSCGGVGIVYDDEFVVISCYFQKQDALTVQGTLLDCAKTDIVVLKSNRIQIQKKDKERASEIFSYLQTADVCARLLFDTANGLSKTEYTQEVAKARLHSIETVLSSLSNLPEEIGVRWNSALHKIKENTSAVSQGIVFAKDVRSLQAQLCIVISQASDLFY